MIKKTLVTFLGFVGLSLIGLGLFSGHSLSSSEALINKTANNTVRMVRPGPLPLASGGIIRLSPGHIVVLTNWHVCHEAVNGYIDYVLQEGAVTHAAVLKAEMPVDLCAVFISQQMSEIKPGIEISHHEASRFEETLALGYPLQGPLTPSFGYTLARTEIKVGLRPEASGVCPPGSTEEGGFFGVVCLVKYDLVLTNNITYPGNSGSPVVNLEGELVGVINSGDQRTAYGNYIPLDTVKTFLRDL